MKIIILGGTRFVGRHIVEALVEGGHAVSVLTRGKSADPLPAAVERLRGDRDAGAAGLAALAGRAWDACVDVSGYLPKQVRPSAELLRDRVGRYLFISTGSVYGDPTHRPVREDHPRMEPIDESVTVIDGETYGRLKVTCEDLLTEIYGERALFLRPQIVAGPHDHTGRYPYWIWRALQPGPMLAPGDGTDHVQVVDGRDVARFARIALEKSLHGAYGLAGVRMTWAEFMTVIGAEALVWVPNEILEAAGLEFDQLPLHRPERGTYAGLMDICNDKARAAGFTITDPAVTAADTRAWLATQAYAPPLSPEREAELIARARAPGPGGR